MRVPEILTDSVAFLCATKSDGSTVYFGTAYFIGVDEPSPSIYGWSYLVTARHCVENAIREYGNVGVRFNLEQGGVRNFNLPPARWIFPEDDGVDAALFPASPENHFDHEMLFPHLFATEDIFASRNIGPGDTLYVAGLFTQMKGRGRNIPILRSGMLSAIPDEPLIDEHSGLEYKGYIAEMRSFGGLSGSPVFAYLDVQPEYRRARGEFYLIGMIRAHWDYWADGTLTSPDESRAMNTGVAIITPLQTYLHVVDNPKERAERRREERSFGELQN